MISPFLYRRQASQRQPQILEEFTPTRQWTGESRDSQASTVIVHSQQSTPIEEGRSDSEALPPPPVELLSSAPESSRMLDSSAPNGSAAPATAVTERSAPTKDSETSRASQPPPVPRVASFPVMSKAISKFLSVRRKNDEWDSEEEFDVCSLRKGL